jgi:hypothetical protein
MMLFITQVVFAQVENMTYSVGMWHPSLNLIAVIKASSPVSTIEIFTDDFTHVISLELTDLSDDIIQIQGENLSWNATGEKIAATFYTTNTTLITSYLVVWNYPSSPSAR